LKRAINRCAIFLWLLLLAVTTDRSIAATNEADEVKRKLMATFPNMKNVGAIEKAPTKELYQVTAGNKVFYFDPDGYLIFGEIWSKDGKNLTAEKRNEIAAQQIKNLPLEKAIRIGNGRNVVIEFTDPDCPYCRRADQFLDQQSNLSRYVFLFPLQMHPEAKNKSRYILSSKDKGAALKEVMSGAFDGKPVPVRDGEQQEALEAMMAVATGMNIQGTPAIWVNGETISGADIAHIDALLKRGVTGKQADR